MSLSGYSCVLNASLDKYNCSFHNSLALFSSIILSVSIPLVIDNALCHVTKAKKILLTTDISKENVISISLCSFLLMYLPEYGSKLLPDSDCISSISSSSLSALSTFLHTVSNTADVSLSTDLAAVSSLVPPDAMLRFDIILKKLR